MAILISNAQARKIFMERQGLSRPPQKAMTRQALYDLIHELGFVQVDSISTVERAHHQILFSRNQTYRPKLLSTLIEKDRLLFEHWTHDASVIPSAFFPYWKHRFTREEARIRQNWTKWQGRNFEEDIFDETLARIAEGGALLSRDMKAEDHKSGGWWNWNPNKTALEFLWRTGKLSIAARENFQKVYDLSERVIPADHHAAEVGHEDFVDWACREALKRLGFATSGEIAAFWALVTPAESKAWVEARRDELKEVTLETVDGNPRAAFAFAEGLDTLLDAPEPPGRIRVLSPFDPLLRDRKRAERLFGFFYRIEIFVPEPQRQYGYYVFPLLEGDRMIGRIDMKADRKAGTLDVKRLWLEPGVRAVPGRFDKLDAELVRVARFAGVETVNYLDGWRGDTN